MGMDVYGESGNYFRNNVWWWHPLAMYVLTAPEELTKSCQHWHSNDGDGLSDQESIALADWLQAEIDAGRTKEYADKYAEKLTALPEDSWDRNYPFTVENVQEFVVFLRESKGFKIH